MSLLIANEAQTCIHCEEVYPADEMIVCDTGSTCEGCAENISMFEGDDPHGKNWE